MDLKFEEVGRALGFDSSTHPPTQVIPTSESCRVNLRGAKKGVTLKTNHTGVAKADLKNGSLSYAHVASVQVEIQGRGAGSATITAEQGLESAALRVRVLSACLVYVNFYFVTDKNGP